MQLVLHQYWRSSSSWRVRFALAWKGLAYETRSIDLLAGDQRGAEHRANNPAGYVPCLVVDGRPLGESVAILEWLEETFPAPPLLPRDAWERARVRQVVETVNAGIQPLHNLSVLHAHAAEPEAQRAWARRFLERGLAALEAIVTDIARETGRDGPYVMGEALSLADVVIVPQLYQARRFGADLACCPRVVALDERIARLDAAIASSPERQPDAR